MNLELSDIGAERAVLAGLFAYGFESYVEINDFIQPESFAHGHNQVIYKCVEKVLESNASIDIPALLSAAEQLKLSESIQTSSQLEYITNLMDYPVNKDNVPFFASQIAKFEFARNAKKIAKKIDLDISKINGDETVDEIISMVEMPLMDFLREDEQGTKTEMLGDNLDEYINFLIVRELTCSNFINGNATDVG